MRHLIHLAMVDSVAVAIVEGAVAAEADSVVAYAAVV